jgi:hypothetical protein
MDEKINGFFKKFGFFICESNHNIYVMKRIICVNFKKIPSQDFDYGNHAKKFLS